MAKRILRKVLLIVGLCCAIYMPAFAEEKATAFDVKEEQTKETVEIADEEVPLGLESYDDFERYKRDLIVMIIFGGMIVLITVAATAKEKYERDKSN